MDLDKISYRHEGLIRSMIDHPEWNYAQHAAQLGYTQSWVSTLANSDMFRAELARRSGEVLISAKEKMRATLDLALESATERIINGKASERFITDIIGSITKTAEFAPKTAPPGMPTLNINMSAEQIALMIERTSEAKRGLAPAKPEVTQSPEGEVIDVGPIEEVLSL